MATINASSSADIIVPSNDGTTYRGLGGDDTYIISNAASGNITIVDTNGSNKIQLVDGLSVASSKFAADSVQLTLSNGAVITVNGADKFTFDVGGNATAGVSGSSNTYAQLASAMGVASLPTGSTISDGSGGTVSGSSIASGATSYSLSADTNSVAEGSTITYTITANSAATADTTFTYNVAGDTNGGTVDKAGAGDTDSLSGTVTLASGATTATFTVKATGDTTAEGLEGIKVTVFDGDLNAIGSQTALISNNAELETTVQNLTTATDELTGGDGKDTFGGSIATNQLAANGNTIAPGDVISGGDGQDTLKISIAGTHTGGGKTLSAVTLSGVEEIQVNNFETSVNDDTIDMSLMSGVTAVGLTSSSATGDTVFSNVPNIVDINHKSGGGNLTVTYSTALGVTTGTQSQVVNVSGLTSTATLRVDGVENITINGGAVKSTFALTADATNHKSFTFTGATPTTISSALGAKVGTIDASGSTGGVNLTVATTATLVITGGPGNDSINFDSSLNALGADIYDGGEGTDTIALDAPATLTPTAVAGITNVEVLQADSSSATSYDANVIPTITTVRANVAEDGTNVTFKDAPSTVNVEVRGTAGIVVTPAVNTTNDVANVTLATAVGLGVIVAAAGEISLTDYETINFFGGATASDTDNIVSAATKTITVSGPAGFTLGTPSSTVLTKIDATGLTGTAGLTMEGNSGTVLYPQTITGSAVADTLIGGSAADTIHGGGGIDTINGAAGIDTINGDAGADIIDGDGGADILSGGAGNDVFSVDDDADFITLASAEVVDGGDGKDTLTISDADGTTIASTDLHGLKSVEVIKFTGNGTAAITLDDTTFTNNGVSQLQISDTDIDTTLTVTASALTADNSIKVNLNTAASTNDTLVGGKGDDIFTYKSSDSATGFDANDTITGGGGTDTFAITMDDNDIGSTNSYITMTGVTSVEKITLANAGTNDVFITLTDGQFVTTATAVVAGEITAGADWTGSGGLYLNGAAEDDSAMTITGGAGADTLTGGAKADTIHGGGGADIINGGAGIDIQTGGAGADTLNLTDVSDFIGLTSVETFDGGAGTDIINFTEDATTTVAAADLLGLTSVEVINFEGTGANTLTLSDSFFTSNGSATITIQDTNASGAVTVDAAGLSAANVIKYKTNVGADTVDTITGGAGDDTFTFYEDTVSASDIVVGGAGTDTFAIYADGGNLSSLTTTGISKMEVLSLSHGATGRNFPVTLTAGFFQGATGTVSAGTVTGVVTLDASAETLTAMTITTGVGNDTITGGYKADTIKAGTGDDIIDGAGGADIMTGGAGADDFQYNNSPPSGTVADSTSAAPDVITDFLSGTDEFDFTITYAALNSGVTINATTLTAVTSKTAAQDALSGKRLEVVYNTTDELLYINYNEDNLITTQDYTIKVNPGATPTATVASADFNWTITGTASADTITTGAGDDIISGGSGNDTINAGDGTNTVNDSAGNDVVYLSNAGLDTVSVASGSDDIKFTSGTDNVAITTITDITAADTDYFTLASHDSVTGFTTTNDEIVVTGALYTAMASGKTAPGTVQVLGGGADADIDAGGVILANTGEKMAGAHTADFIDIVKVIAMINDVTGSAEAADVEANSVQVVIVGDADLSHHGVYYWKDVDGSATFNNNDQIALLAVIATDATLVSTDVISQSGT